MSDRIYEIKDINGDIITVSPDLITEEEKSKRFNAYPELVKVAKYFKDLTDNPDDFDDDNGMPTTVSEGRSEFANNLLKKLGEL